MSFEAQQTQTPTPERISPSPGEIATAFAEAQQTLYKMTASESFHGYCADAGIHPVTDTDKPLYWKMVADQAEDIVEQARSQQGNSLHLSTFQLLAITPDFLLKAIALGSDHSLTPAQRHENKETTSYFNSVLRIFATDFPEVRASAISKALLNVTNIALEDRQLRQAGATEINRTIHGAQHELAFGQILKHTGRRYTTASLEDDLQGIDYLVWDDNGMPLGIDVKASLYKIAEKGGQLATLRHQPKGDIITMYSLTTESELHDRFFTDESVAARKASILNQLITLAIHASHTA